jgi:hypothetical protein
MTLTYPHRHNLRLQVAFGYDELTRTRPSSRATALPLSLEEGAGALSKYGCEIGLQVERRYRASP